jgi:glutamate formiminotransferase
MGRFLASLACAQVSMNLTNFRETDLDAVFEAIRVSAEVESCHLVGFVPMDAFEKHPAFFRRAENFMASRILENRIKELDRYQAQDRFGR